MKYKEILKKAWLPALTVLAICAGAVALNATMRTSEAQQLEQTAISAVQPTPDDASGSTTENVASSDEVTPTPAPASEPSLKPSGDYRYMQVASDNGSEPGAQDISSFEAGQAVVGVMEAVFGDAFTSGSHDIYVKYQTYNGHSSSTYVIMVGSETEGDATYIGSVESVSGQVRTVIKWVPDNRRIWDDSADKEDDELDKAARSDKQQMDAVEKLINNSFSDGRIIKEIIIDATQWASQDPDADLVVDYKVHMNTGECYMVRMAYPSRTVSELFIYPLGWDSCLKGYWDETDSPDYIPSEGWETAEGIHPAATPAPTTAPVSTSKPAQ